tara:strand:+ start:11305 stop:11532 length:228 start_codon:yes stop_codon:yes gene_type:complete
MPKTKEQTAKENAVKTYREVSAVFKTNLIQDVNTAFTQGTVNIEDNEKDRFLSLLSNLIDVHQANGHEQFTRLNK